MLRDNTDGVNPNDAVSNRRDNETDVGIINADNLRSRYVQLLLKLSFFPLLGPLSASLSDVFFHRGTEDFVR